MPGLGWAATRLRLTPLHRHGRACPGHPRLCRGRAPRLPSMHGCASSRPRSAPCGAKSWMAGPSPAMTGKGVSAGARHAGLGRLRPPSAERHPSTVMAGLVPAIHAFAEEGHHAAAQRTDARAHARATRLAARKSWMAGPSPAMTEEGGVSMERVMPGLGPGIHAYCREAVMATPSSASSRVSNRAACIQGKIQGSWAVVVFRSRALHPALRYGSQSACHNSGTDNARVQSWLIPACPKNSPHKRSAASIGVNDFSLSERPKNASILRCSSYSSESTLINPFAVLFLER